MQQHREMPTVGRVTLANYKIKEYLSDFCRPERDPLPDEGLEN